MRYELSDYEEVGTGEVIDCPEPTMSGPCFKMEEDVNATKHIVDFFDRLQGLDGEIVYLRLSTYVGYGRGLHEVPKNVPVRAGVVYDLVKDDGSYSYMDGFGGNRSDYKCGYTVDLDGYRNKWQRNRHSTLLFPLSGNEFFDVHYMKAFALDGLAKIRITSMQGFQWIEIVPAHPFGDLLGKYYDIQKKLPKKWFFEF